MTSAFLQSIEGDKVCIKGIKKNGQKTKHDKLNKGKWKKMLGFTEKNRFMWREVASESRGGMLKSEDRYN